MSPELPGFFCIQKYMAALLTQDINIYMITGLFLFTGSMHFITPGFFLKIMPDYIPYHKAMVFWSGIAEIAGAVGFFIPFFRLYTAWGLILLLLAVFPANIEMFLKARRKRGFVLFTWLTLLRLPFQPLMIWWVFVTAELGIK